MTEFRIIADPKANRAVFESVFASRLATAAQAALREAAADVKSQADASIAQAGFSDAWRHALRVQVFPANGASLSGAISVRHNIPYAGVFEAGATIEGKPLLWLPLPSCPAQIGRRRASPSAYEATIGPLRFVQGRKYPLLVGQSTTAPPEPPAPGASRFKGARRQTLGALRAGAARSGQSGVHDVPMFFGVDAVTVGKKFDVLGAVERAYSQLAASFPAHLSEG